MLSKHCCIGQLILFVFKFNTRLTSTQIKYRKVTIEADNRVKSIVYVISCRTTIVGIF